MAKTGKSERIMELSKFMEYFFWLLIFSLLLCGCESRYEREVRERQEKYEKQLAEEKATFSRLTTKEHLERVKKADSISNAERHKDAIPKGTPEHKEAQRFLDKEHLARMKKAVYISEAESHMYAISKGTPEYKEARLILEKKKQQKRIEYANTLTDRMLDNEINFTAYTKGKDDTILVCEFAILTDVTIHHIRKKWEPSGVQEMGLKKVLLTHKFRRGYEYELWSDK